MNKITICASISYIHIMPTFSHPTGKRAHLMNVYTKSSYRRKGIAHKMCGMLINDVWNKGVTEISLDATVSGRPLYKSLGFEDSFLSVDWSSGHYPDKLVVAMENFKTVYSAWDNDRIVGMICAMDDGIMNAYVHYLLVNPEYHGQKMWENTC